MDRKFFSLQINKLNEDLDGIRLKNTLSELMMQTPPIPLI